MTNHTVTPTFYPGHKPNTHKIYNTVGRDGREAWTIEFLDTNGNLRNAKGGKIYKHRQNAQRDCTALNHPIKHAIKRYGQCEAYHDGYTATVTDCTDEGEGYRLSIQVGQMPPHFSQNFNTIEEAEEEMRDRSTFPVTVTWSSVKPEEI
jgi:hypothetical protein